MHQVDSDRTTGTLQCFTGSEVDMSTREHCRIRTDSPLGFLVKFECMVHHWCHCILATCTSHECDCDQTSCSRSNRKRRRMLHMRQEQLLKHHAAQEQTSGKCAALRHLLSLRMTHHRWCPCQSVMGQRVHPQPECSWPAAAAALGSRAPAAQLHPGCQPSTAAAPGQRCTGPGQLPRLHNGANVVCWLLDIHSKKSRLLCQHCQLCDSRAALTALQHMLRAKSITPKEEQPHVLH